MNKMEEMRELKEGIKEMKGTKEMKKRFTAGLTLALFMAAFLAVCGCGEKEKSVTEAQNPDTAVQAEIQTEKVLEEPQEAEEIPEKEPLQEKEEIPVTEETDWSGYFDGLNGAAVLYWPSENRYQIYNAELDRLQYGNCDISDWEGRLNTNNSNRALTGFWIESSLKISPKEQTEVMERIFGRDSEYSAETQQDLMDVMLVTEQNDSAAAVYGKTGMGKDRGITVDAWFTGFADTADGRVCFCVYLGETEGREVTSAGAREIALKLLADYE